MSSVVDQRGQRVGIQFNVVIPGASPSGKPLQRPRRAEHFTGREEELARLLKALVPGRTVTVHAPGGMGKTALVAELVARCAPGIEPPDAFPDGIVFYSFYGRPEPERALDFIARSYGVEPKPSAADAARLALSSARAMVVLDGAEEASDLGRVLACAGDGCCVVVTTRRRADAPDYAHCHELQPLSEDDAVSLLRETASVEVGDEGVGRIVELVGRLPLAVRLVGRYLGQTGEAAAHYLRWLEATPLEALAPVNSALHREDSVPYLLERSVEQVSESGRHVLSVAARVALADFDGAMPAEVLEYDEDERRRAFDVLVGYGLLRKSGERYEVSHALIHTYARERLAVTPARMARLRAYYEELVKGGSGEGADGHARVGAEHPHLMHLIGDGLSGKDWEFVKRLANAAADYLDLSGRWVDFELVLGAGATAARAQEDRAAEGSFLGNLGIGYAAVGQVERAIEHHKKALVISREIGDRRGEGKNLGDLGLAYAALGRVERAIEHHEKALVISREIGNRRGEGNQLGNLGNIYADLGQIKDAIEYYEKALVISREIGDRRGEGSDLGNLGLVYADLGQVERAIELHEAALVILREIGDRRGEASQLGNLGLAYGASGQVERAIEHHEQALAIARDTDARREEGTQLGNLGVANATVGRTQRAIKHHEEALVILRQVGDRRGEANQLGNLGVANAILGRAERAIEHHEEALAIFREVSDRCGEGKTLGNLGGVYATLGEGAQARECWKQALVISREIGDLYLEEMVLDNLADADADIGNTKRAKDPPETALVIAREKVDRSVERAAQLGNLGNDCLASDQWVPAIEHYEEALAIFREVGDRRGEGRVHSYLGAAYVGLAKFAPAVKHQEGDLVIQREIGDRRGEGNIFLGLSDVRDAEVVKEVVKAAASSRLKRIVSILDPRRFKEAIDHYEEALVIQREIGDRRWEGNTLRCLGDAYMDLRLFKGAIEHYEGALVIQREIGDRSGEGRVLGNLGVAHAEFGQFERAIEYYEEALVIQREIGDQSGESNTLGALDVVRSHRRGKGSVLRELGARCKKLVQVKRAMEHWRRGWFRKR